MNPTRMAIFASGQGTNCQSIMSHFAGNERVEVAFVLTNNKDAGVIYKAKAFGVKTYVCTNNDVADANFLLNLCNENNIDYVILAGYLRKIPNELIVAFPERIINIHPALLPKFGGEGMYGMNVHRAVKTSNEKTTGITIHFVNANYDEGRIISQVSCDVDDSDTPESIQEKVHQLEYIHYPLIIEKTILV